MAKSDHSTLAQATLLPSGKRFTVAPAQSLLDSGLSAGIPLPFGCANGSCGECRARVRTGLTNKLRPHDFTLSEAQKLAGECLLCSYGALTDVQLEVCEARSVNDIPVQHLTTKLSHHERTTDADLVTLKFVRGKALRFLPGQSITLNVANGNTMSLPIASCPCNSELVELHLFTASSTDSDAGTIAAEVIDYVTTNKHIAISGPTGGFTLSDEVKKPKIFFAVGGDFARLQGMIEQIFNADLGTPCCLIWKATPQVSHYRSNLCRSWHDAFDEFCFVPISAQEEPIAALPASWHGSIRTCEVYLGGEYDTLIEALIEHGIAPSSIHYPNAAVATGNSA